MEIKHVIELSPKLEAILTQFAAALTGGSLHPTVASVSEAAPAKPAAKKAPAAKAEKLAAVAIEAPKKAGKKKAEPEAEAEEPSDEELEETQDEGDGEQEDSSEDFSEEIEDAVEEDKLSDEELEKLKKALSAHSKKNGSKQATIKILMKYAKKSDDVKPADLPKLLKELKV